MKFRVTGADRDTGEIVAIELEAVDRAAAERDAQRRGLLVSDVERIDRVPFSYEPPQPKPRVLVRPVPAHQALRNVSTIFIAGCIAAFVVAIIRLNEASQAFGVGLSVEAIATLLLATLGGVLFGLIGLAVADIARRG